MLPQRGRLGLWAALGVPRGQGQLRQRAQRGLLGLWAALGGAYRDPQPAGAALSVPAVRGQTFSTAKGTALYRARKPHGRVVQVVTLLAHGCPPQAIVA